MNIIELIRINPDGRVFTYHRIHEITVNMSNSDFVEILIGSWDVEADVIHQTRSPITTSVLMDKSVLEQHSLLEQILMLPQWQGGIIRPVNTGATAPVLTVHRMGEDLLPTEI